MPKQSRLLPSPFPIPDRPASKHARSYSALSPDIQERILLAQAKQDSLHSLRASHEYETSQEDKDFELGVSQSLISLAEQVEDDDEGSAIYHAELAWAMNLSRQTSALEQAARERRSSGLGRDVKIGTQAPQTSPAASTSSTQSAQSTWLLTPSCSVAGPSRPSCVKCGVKGEEFCKGCEWEAEVMERGRMAEREREFERQRELRREYEDEGVIEMRVYKGGKGKGKVDVKGKGKARA